MKKFDTKKYPIYASFLNQLAKDLTKFYYAKLDKPFKITNKMKGKGYDPVTTSDKAFEKFIRSKKDLELYVDLMDKDNLYIPWIPSASFMTNGVEVKVKIETLSNDRMNGIKEIVKRCYSGFKKDKSKRDITKVCKGIHKIDNLYINKQDINNYTYLGIDPGMIKPMSSCFIKDGSLPYDWNSNKRCDLLKKSLNTNKYVSRKFYNDIICFNETNKHEILRRKINCKYNEALNQIGLVKRRTCLLNENIEYNKIKFKYWNILKNEKMTYNRTLHRFLINIKIQKAVDKSVKRILHSSIKEGKELIIFFGDGKFKVGGYGYSCIPKKKFLKKIGENHKVLITNENNTSKLCPFTFNELKSIDQSRLRKCKTLNESQNQSIENYYDVEDRDTLGSLSICQKGFYELIKNPLINYYN